MMAPDSDLPNYDRRMAELILCEGCQKHVGKDECCNGLCEACRRFYSGECDKMIRRGLP